MLGLATPRDIDQVCRYQTQYTPREWADLYKVGPANRVVDVYPEESWQVDPKVYETEAAKVRTKFEQALDNLAAHHNLWAVLAEFDKLAGVGRYGVLLLGLSDGLALHQPARKANQLLYLRPFMEVDAEVVATDTDPTSPRFGQPTLYNLKFSNPDDEPHPAAANTEQVVQAHHSRVIHFAEARKGHPWLGDSRMGPVRRQLQDIRKILGGSAEMYYQQGAGGLAIEADADHGVQLDYDSIKAQVQAYQDDLQRYIALEGATAKPLAGQVSDPEPSVMVQLRIVAITLGIPLRYLMGAEAAHLASTQDTENWNKKLARRQSKVINPEIILPTITRLQTLGILPMTPNPPIIDWPDLNETADSERAATAAAETEALAKYVGGGVQAAVPPREYMTHVLKWEDKVVDAIMDAAEAQADDDSDDDLAGGTMPPGDPLPALADMLKGIGGPGAKPSPAGQPGPPGAKPGPPTPTTPPVAGKGAK
jgi:uncharacterized protein